MSYTPATKTLPVFGNIHDKGEKEEESETCMASEVSECNISDIEMSPEMIKNAIFGAVIKKSCVETHSSTSQRSNSV